MTASRTSNKQILDAIEKLTEVLTQNLTPVQAAVSAAPPVLTPVNSEPTVTEGEGNVKVDAKYKGHMESKFLAYAAKVGEPVVGYAYKKSNGQTGLWSVPASKWAESPRIKNLIGPIGIYGDNAS